MSTTTSVDEGKKTAKPRGKKNLAGVDMSRFKRELLTAAMDKLKVEYDKKFSDDQLTLTAAGAFETKGGDLGECDECGGKSPLTLDACPFCGSEGEEDQPEAAKADAKPAQPAQPAKVETAAPKAAEKEATMSTTTTTEKAGKKPAVNGTSTALAKAGASALSGGTDEKHLDKALGEARALLAQGAVTYRALGLKVKQIRDDGLWKHRLNDDGKSKYKNFEAFCHAELNFSPQHALNLMDTASHFTDDQVRQLGVSKLTLVLRAPAEDRDEALTAAQQKSKKELAAHVQKLNVKKGHTKARRDGKKAASAEKLAAKAERDKKKAAEKKTVTVANLVGKVQIKLYKKPTTKAFKLTDLERAKKAEDQPYGEAQLTNGVRQRFMVQKSAAGDLVLIILTERHDEE